MAAAILIPVVVSLAAWALPAGPDTVLQGFRADARVTSPAAFVIAAVYYLAAAGLADYGYRRGRRMSGLQAVSRVSLSTVQWSSVALGTVGTVYSIALAWRFSGTDPVSAGMSGELNRFAAGLPASAGIQTLRYSAVVCGGIAIARLALKPSGVVLARDGGSLALMMTVFALGDRFLMVAALSIAVASGLAIVRRNGSSPRRIRWPGVAAVLIVLAASFVAVSWGRTSNTYARAGHSQPWQPAFFQARAYLSAPMQGTLGIVDAMSTGDLRSRDTDWRPAAAFPWPAFLLSNLPAPVVSREERERVTGIPWAGFSTNGSITEIVSTGGVMSFITGALAIAAFSILVGLSTRSGPAGGVLAGVLVLPFLDLWRTFAFKTGYVIYMGISVLLIALAARAIRWWARP